MAAFWTILALAAFASSAKAESAMLEVLNQLKDMPSELAGPVAAMRSGAFGQKPAPSLLSDRCESFLDNYMECRRDARAAIDRSSVLGSGNDNTDALSKGNSMPAGNNAPADSNNYDVSEPVNLNQ